VRDLNGYVLRFAGQLVGEGGAGSPPGEVRIESRPPTPEELAALSREVGWEGGFRVPPAAAVAGAVALVDDAPIGCAVATTDSAGFYHVRDVMVVPSWQRRRVGSALMETLIDQLDSVAPSGALSALFTGLHLEVFYSRFGFRAAGSGLLGMTRTIP
jgi:GNAT superfamily N-acetyltransferase